MKRILMAAGCVAALAGLAYTPAASPLPQDGWTTIKGRITWEGKAPERKKINVTVDKVACLAKGDVVDEDFMINPKNKGMANVFVWLAPLEDGGKLPINPGLKDVKDKKVHMDQPCCMFEPRVVGIREGQELVAKNSATVSHNIRWTGHPDFNAGGNVTLPPGKEYVLPTLKAQKLPLLVECNIHPWMKGRIGVFDHPYFAVTDENGNFEIKLAPRGNYRLFIYHELGWRGGKDGKDGQPITVQGGQGTDLGDVVYNVKK